MASQGPLSAGGGSDIAGTGSVTWLNPRNIDNSDDAYATATDAGLGSTTHYLVSDTHAFSIPVGATIDGILVEWERKGSGLFLVSDARARIVKGGVIGSTERSAGAGWATSDQYDSFGSSVDLWGETWTYNDINDSGFGAALSATLSTFSVASVDHCRITVYYTEAGTFDPKFFPRENMPDLIRAKQTVVGY